MKFELDYSKMADYGQKTYAHIWAYGPNIHIYGPYLGQISIISNGVNFLPCTPLIYTFSELYNSKHLKMSISGPKNLEK